MNVLLIMADELSTWGLGCYGGYSDDTAAQICTMRTSRWRMEW
jgi:arylsulfatase A-like enzyme